jgi:hypothetical protein
MAFKVLSYTIEFLLFFGIVSPFQYCILLYYTHNSLIVYILTSYLCLSLRLLTVLNNICCSLTCVYLCSRLSPVYTDMRRLTMGIRSEKCVVRRFRRCANVYLTQI